MPQPEQVRRMQRRITSEVFYALGLGRQSFWQKALGWLFYLPTLRFSKIFAEADEEVGKNGLCCGCSKLLPHFNVNPASCGHETIPPEGALLVVSNHPGAYDSVTIAALLPRKDLKILVSDIPFYKALPNTHPCFIYVSYRENERMLALREAIQHLQQGGAVLLFGTGLIDPDPALFDGGETEINQWSPSIEVLLRKAPQTQLVLAIASGVVAATFAKSPLIRLRKKPLDQRRLAEMLQIIWQLMFPASLRFSPKISFAAPLGMDEMTQESTERRLLPVIITHALELLKCHRQKWGLTSQPAAKTGRGKQQAG